MDKLTGQWTVLYNTELMKQRATIAPRFNFDLKWEDTGRLNLRCIGEFLMGELNFVVSIPCFYLYPS